MTTLTDRQMILLKSMTETPRDDPRDPERDELCSLGYARHVVDGGTQKEYYVLTRMGRDATGIEYTKPTLALTTQTEIFKRMQDLIPKNLWERYNHLTFGEMATTSELAEWADELTQAETDWHSAE